MNRFIIAGLIMALMTANAFGSESDGIFSVKVGSFEVFMLVEAERDGNAGILINADDALLSRYIPAGGFKHSANAFLVKAPGQNILIDTGTGVNGIVVEKIKSLGVALESVNAVLITHLHGDHFGSLQKDGKAVFPNAAIYLSEKELEYFTKIAVNQGAVAALAPYASRVKTFEPGKLGSKLAELLPGIYPIAAYGHTPGHAMFLLESGKQKLLIVGDLLHVALIQFPVPEISAIYDMDAKAAAEMRRQVFAYAVKNKIPIGGMHLVYPAVGTLKASGKGYAFTPSK
jgi:glyoxylase-like metal-dependent hydrolase (beta-lactamase superfamily II)